MVVSVMNTMRTHQTHETTRQDAAPAGLRPHRWQQDQTEEPQPRVSREVAVGL
jgi:hypothetical protein